MKRLYALALAAALLTSGCGTIMGGRIHGVLRPMGGVKRDVGFITGDGNYYSAPWRYLFILDLPFSFLYDVVLLPATLAVDDGR